MGFLFFPGFFLMYNVYKWGFYEAGEEMICQGKRTGSAVQVEL